MAVMRRMRAAGIDAFGANVRLLELAAPGSPAPDELVVSVCAAGVGNWDEIVRVGDWDVGRKPPLALGVEAAGVVAAVGEEVTGFALGDEVLTHPLPLRHQGTWAELLVAPAALVAQKPAAVPWETAAAFPVPALTADQALSETAPSPAGAWVLVHGAGGVTGGLGRPTRGRARSDGRRNGGPVERVARPRLRRACRPGLPRSRLAGACARGSSRRTRSRRRRQRRPWWCSERPAGRCGPRPTRDDHRRSTDTGTRSHRREYLRRSRRRTTCRTGRSTRRWAALTHRWGEIRVGRRGDRTSRRSHRPRRRRDSPHARPRRRAVACATRRRRDRGRPCRACPALRLGRTPPARVRASRSSRPQAVAARPPPSAPARAAARGRARR